MTYRDPAPRKPRLWYVIFSFLSKTGISYTSREWVWAVEGHIAIAQQIHKMVKSGEIASVEYVSDWRTAICGEDFAEREEKGPPPEEKK